MGFIEELRRQKQNKMRVAREETSRRIREAVEDNKRQIKEDDYHRERIRQAKDFLSSSAFPKLSSELFRVLPTITVLNREPSKYERPDYLSGWPFRQWPILGEDSIWIGIILSSKYIGHGFDEGVYRSKEERKIIAIESCPDGTLIVHGNSSRKLPLGSWRGNDKIQEDALEAAYKNPKKMKYWLRRIEPQYQG